MYVLARRVYGCLAVFESAASFRTRAPRVHYGIGCAARARAVRERVILIPKLLRRQTIGMLGDRASGTERELRPQLSYQTFDPQRYLLARTWTA